jgi:hypothetical protein
MGVMECDRVGCTNILCDRWSPQYGYICDECFDELVTLGRGVNVEEFMADKKPCSVEDDPYEYYDRLFSRND